MASLEIDETEAKQIEEKMIAIAEKLSKVSNGNYISTSPFTDSQGQSVEALNEMLTGLSDCANIMQEVIVDTAKYLAVVIDAFTMVEEKYEEIFNPTKPNTEKPDYHKNT